jgi:hypothetical protein
LQSNILLMLHLFMRAKYQFNRVRKYALLQDLTPLLHGHDAQRVPQPLRAACHR